CQDSRRSAGGIMDRVRFWQGFSAALALALAVAIAGSAYSVFAPTRKQRFDEIDVGRINGFGFTRVFVGKGRNKDASVRSDEKGRERLRLVVTAKGDARIEFLDERGQATLTLPTQAPPR